MALKVLESGDRWPAEVTADKQLYISGDVECGDLLSTNKNIIPNVL